MLPAYKAIWYKKHAKICIPEKIWYTEIRKKQKNTDTSERQGKAGSTPGIRIWYLIFGGRIPRISFLYIFFFLGAGACVYRRLFLMCAAETSRRFFVACLPAMRATDSIFYLFPRYSPKTFAAIL